MARALPQHDEAVGELEEHLRDHFTSLQQEGASENEAFALAEKRIGEPHAIALEFKRMSRRWKPGVFALPVVGLILSLAAGYSLWMSSRRFPITYVQVASYVTISTAFFGVIGASVIAASAFFRNWLHPLSAWSRRAVSQRLRNLALVAGLFLPLSWPLNMIWHMQFAIRPSTLWPYHLRFIMIVVSVALLVIVHSRSAVSDRVRWVTAIFPFLVLIFGSFPPFIRIADIPVRWVCVALLLAQLWLALPRFRVHIERLHETK